MHPDRFADRPAAERARAERRMQDLNAAWSVLSDEKKRSAYDKAVADASPRATGPLNHGRPDPAFRPFDNSEPFVRPQHKGPKVASEKDMEITGFARLMRIGPLAILLGAFLGIFVITAIIGSRDSDTPVVEQPQTGISVPPTGTPIQCLDIRSVNEVIEVPCSGPKNAIVWSISPRGGEPCDPELESVYRPSLGGSYCVTRE